MSSPLCLTDLSSLAEVPPKPSFQPNLPIYDLEDVAPVPPPLGPPLIEDPFRVLEGYSKRFNTKLDNAYPYKGAWRLGSTHKLLFFLR